MEAIPAIDSPGNCSIQAKNVLENDDHPEALELTSYQCRKCKKWTTIDHLNRNKSIYYCAFCSAPMSLKDPLFTQEELAIAIDLSKEILQSFYEKKKKTIKNRPDILTDYIND